MVHSNAMPLTRLFRKKRRSEIDSTDTVLVNPLY